MRCGPSHGPVWGLVKHRKGVQRRWTVQRLHNRLPQSLWPPLHRRGAAAPSAVSQTLPCKRSWSKAVGTRRQWEVSPGGRRKAEVMVSIPEGALCGWTACLFQWPLKVTRRGERRVCCVRIRPGDQNPVLAQLWAGPVLGSALASCWHQL